MIRRLLFFSVFLYLVLPLVGCIAQQVEPHYSDTQETENAEYPPSIQVEASLLTAYPPPLPTVAVTSPPLPTHVPTPTTPPMPTPLPTPVVTPIPILPEGTFNRIAESFWIYYWYEDEIWRIDSAGNDAELLLDVRETLGQTLAEITAHPEPAVFSGPRVTIAPSGSHIALVTAASADDASYRYSLYTYDVTSGDVRSLGPGAVVSWAADGERLAFVRGETIQVADVTSGAIEQVAAEVAGRVVELSWSSDGHYLFYVYDTPSGGWSIWMVDVADPAQSGSLLPSDWTVGHLRPRPNSEDLLFITTVGSRDPQYYLTQNLWAVSPTSGEMRQLTHDLWINRVAISSDGIWAIVQGIPMQVPDAKDPLEQMWLLQLNSGELFGLPIEEEPINLLGWSPGEGQWLTVTNTNEATDLVLIATNDFTSRRMVFPAGSRFLMGQSVQTEMISTLRTLQLLT